MAVYKEFGHKNKMILMQEVTVDGTLYLLSVADGIVHEKAEGLPVVKDKEIIAKVKKAAE